MSNQAQETPAIQHPLDSIEDVLDANNWIFDRMTRDELMVTVTGRFCDYQVFFIWQEDMNALQFCAQYDLKVANDNYEQAAQMLMRINERLWMGHFDLPEDTKTPSFRHTCLFRGLDKRTSADFLEDLVDVSLAQCEQHFPVFHILANDQKLDDKQLALAIMDNAGEA